MDILRSNQVDIIKSKLEKNLFEVVAEEKLTFAEVFYILTSMLRTWSNNFLREETVEARMYAASEGLSEMEGN